MRRLLLILCLCTCGKPQAEDSGLEKGASIRLKDFSRKSFTIDGSEEWDLTAGEAYVFRKADAESKIVAYNLDFQQFDGGKKTGRVKAERGEIDYKNKVLHLSGKVSFVDPERSVSSEKLTYQMETKILESDASVLLVESGTTTHCRRGITVNRETNVQVCRAPAVVRITRSGDSKGLEDL
ncbi:MAG: LPS export ABC transporter periplasmic protein LptC [Spirochaetia bacterium]|nr:LPS export ABC transporter periplasmic protein LptC [Spirochaetia bacterium]